MLLLPTNGASANAIPSGKLPFWISPSQIMVIPVSEDFNDYSVEVNKKLIASGLNSEVDLKNHNLNYKIT